MLLLLSPSSRGVSSPELLSELDNVMSDPIDALQLQFKSASWVVLLDGPSWKTVGGKKHDDINH